MIPHAEIYAEGVSSAGGQPDITLKGCNADLLCLAFAGQYQPSGWCNIPGYQ